MDVSSPDASANACRKGAVELKLSGAFASGDGREVNGLATTDEPRMQ